MATENSIPDQTDEFINLYEILEIDMSADLNEIEAQFMAIGQKLHPSVPDTGDEAKFELLTRAIETLRLPESREAYDQIYMEQAGEMSAAEAAKAADISDAYLENMDLEKEAADRVLLMKKFYETRRVSQKEPGLAAGGLDGVIDCSTAMIDFHLWYCQHKGWLLREEGGQLSITALGADHVENVLKNKN